MIYSLFCKTIIQVCIEASISLNFLVSHKGWSGGVSMLEFQSVTASLRTSVILLFELRL